MSGNDRETIIAKLQQASEKLLDKFSTVPEDKINTIPFEGSWTVGQLIQHLNKSNYGMLKLMTGPTRQTERDPAGVVEKIQTSFMDFSKKTEAPEFVKPSDEKQDKSFLLERMRNTYREITKVLSNEDLSQTCTAFGFPVYGELTRLELGWFITYHTLRHTRQLENMISELEKTN